MTSKRPPPLPWHGPGGLDATRVLRAVGELGRVDLVGELREALRDDDPSCRLGAGWSGC